MHNLRTPHYRFPQTAAAERHQVKPVLIQSSAAVVHRKASVEEPTNSAILPPAANHPMVVARQTPPSLAMMASVARQIQTSRYVLAAHTGLVAVRRDGVEEHQIIVV